MTLQDWESIASITQALATVIAIVVGGVWTYMLFVRQRAGLSRASVAHEVQVHQLEDHTLVRANIIVTNVGTALVRPESLDVWVQHVLPVEIGALDNFKGDDPDLNWPLLARREIEWPAGRAEVEPGETQTFPFDFVLDTTPTRIQIYSYIRNTSKTGKVIGWRTVSMHDTKKEVTHVLATPTSATTRTESEGGAAPTAAKGSAQTTASSQGSSASEEMKR